MCAYVLLTVYGARECILPTPVLVDSWEFYFTTVQPWPYTWHQSRNGWCNCYLWKVHHSTGTLLKHITDTCQIVFEMVKILWLHSCIHDSPLMCSNLFMHVIVTKSPPFENVRGGSNMRLVVRFELTKYNYDCRQSVSMCVVCGILEFDEFHPK